MASEAPLYVSLTSSLSEVSNIPASQSGLVHRNKGGSDGPTHQARPLNSLADPSSFAPPPTRRGTGLAPAPPPSTEKRAVVMAPSKYQDPRAAKVAPPPKVSAGEGLLEYQRQSREQFGGGGGQQQLTYQQEPEEEEAPRGPYRVNTSGLSTDHLPKPPTRRDGADGRGPPPVPPPPSYDTALSHPQQPPSKPGLPPRLPARTNAGSASSYTPPSAPASPAPDNLINQDAANRLGNAGVSVPALGIGSRPVASPSPPPPPRRQPTGGAGAGAHLGELQNRFSKLNTNSPAAAAPSEGTSWAQKQAAVNTASSLQKDPSSVSMADARSAAGVANNFRQRHGDQVASGLRSANNLSQRYGGGVNNAQQQEAPAAPASPVAGLAGKKKPPPPPPKKKPGLGGGGSSAGASPVAAPEDDAAPPPIPLSTRPTF